MLNKNDKLIAIVTGANRGIGFAAARQLAQRGMRVILTSRNAGKGEAAAEQLMEDGLEVLFHVLDVTSESSVASLGEFVHSRCGRVDILVNNAGIYLDSRNPDDPHAGSVFNASLATLEITANQCVWATVTGPGVRALDEASPLRAYRECLQRHGPISRYGRPLARLPYLQNRVECLDPDFGGGNNRP
jgi:NAD(P)-dependent dehydrogenase (short-subunit alcohol dehydrogenase family)